jgi:transposase-like protein
MDRYPDSVRNAAFEMIRSGTTAVDLADRFEISRGTAYLWIRDLRKSGEDVAFLKRPDRVKDRVFARLVEGASIDAISEELGVSRAQLRRWVDIFEERRSSVAASGSDGKMTPAYRDEASVTRRRKVPETAQDVLIKQLKTALAEKTLEVDFFRGALREVEARRRQNTEPGEKPSTSGSSK